MLTGILGAFRAGLVAVPVSTMFTGVELGAILADSGARAVLATHEHAEAVAGAAAMAPEVEHVVLHGDAALALPGSARLQPGTPSSRAGPPPTRREPAATDADSWALWLYTSGTTGPPKAAMHRHANIRHVCETYGQQVLGIGPDDTMFSVAKLFFAYGIGNSVFFPLSVGARSVLDPRRPTPHVVPERCRRTSPRCSSRCPTFYAALLAGDLPDDTFASVRLAPSAGEPLPAALLQPVPDRFGVDELDGIGSTEALHIFMSNRPGDIRPGHDRRAGPGLRRRGARRRRAPSPPPASRVPCTCAASRSRSATGAGPPPPGRCSRASGWHRRHLRPRRRRLLHLPRPQQRHAQGRRHLGVARRGRGPADRAPAVARRRWSACPTTHGIDKPVAAVVPAASTEAELIAWCRDGLAHFKAPRQVIFVDELPKTATGKLQRFKVRGLFDSPDQVVRQDDQLDPPRAEGGDPCRT